MSAVLDKALANGHFFKNIPTHALTENDSSTVAAQGGDDDSIHPGRNLPLEENPNEEVAFSTLDVLVHEQGNGDCVLNNESPNDTSLDISTDDMDLSWLEEGMPETSFECQSFNDTMDDPDCVHRPHNSPAYISQIDAQTKYHLKLLQLTENAQLPHGMFATILGWAQEASRNGFYFSKTVVSRNTVL